MNNFKKFFNVLFIVTLFSSAQCYAQIEFIIGGIAGALYYAVTKVFSHHSKPNTVIHQHTHTADLPLQSQEAFSKNLEEQVRQEVERRLVGFIGIQQREIIREVMARFTAQGDSNPDEKLMKEFIEAVIKKYNLDQQLIDSSRSQHAQSQTVQENPKYTKHRAENVSALIKQLEARLEDSMKTKIRLAMTSANEHTGKSIIPLGTTISDIERQIRQLQKTIESQLETTIKSNSQTIDQTKKDLLAQIASLKAELEALKLQNQHTKHKAVHFDFASKASAEQPRQDTPQESVFKKRIDELEKIISGLNTRAVQLETESKAHKEKNDQQDQRLSKIESDYTVAMEQTTQSRQQFVAQIDAKLEKEAKERKDALAPLARTVAMNTRAIQELPNQYISKKEFDEHSAEYKKYKDEQAKAMQSYVLSQLGGLRLQITSIEQLNRAHEQRITKLETEQICDNCIPKYIHRMHLDKFTIAQRAVDARAEREKKKQAQTFRSSSGKPSSRPAGLPISDRKGLSSSRPHSIATSPAGSVHGSTVSSPSSTVSSGNSNTVLAVISSSAPATPAGQPSSARARSLTGSPELVLASTSPNSASGHATTSAGSTMSSAAGSTTILAVLKKENDDAGSAAATSSANVKAKVKAFNASASRGRGASAIARGGLRGGLRGGRGGHSSSQVTKAAIAKSAT
jgi:hypothetical protein